MITGTDEVEMLSNIIKEQNIYKKYNNRYEDLLEHCISLLT